MRMLLTGLVILLAACENKTSDQTPANADTTQVIELAVKTVLGGHFPEMDSVKKKTATTDSIYFTTNLFSLSHLPAKVDSFNFKVLADSLICPILKLDTTSMSLTNYLRLQTFQKTDSGYFVEFESIYCFPNPSRDASVGLHILKTKDKFEFKN